MRGRPAGRLNTKVRPKADQIQEGKIMGCDIHLYIEHREKNPGKWLDWSPFGGRTNPGRDYGVFERLAGVRSDGENPSFEPRGLPEHLGYESRGDSRLYVCETETEEEGSCSREQAKKWVAQGTSEWADADKQWVTHPDWHSHSWLTAGEFREAITDVASRYQREGHKVDVRWWAVLAALSSLEENGHDARVVFWFDN